MRRTLITLAAVIAAALGYAGTAYADTDLPVQPPTAVDSATIDAGAVLGTPAAAQPVNVDLAPAGAVDLPARAPDPVALTLSTSSLFSPDVPAAEVQPASSAVQPIESARPAPSTPSSSRARTAPAPRAVNAASRPYANIPKILSDDGPSAHPVLPAKSPAAATPTTSAPAYVSAVFAPRAHRDTPPEATPPASMIAAAPAVPALASPATVFGSHAAVPSSAPLELFPFTGAGLTPASAPAPTGGGNGGFAAALVALLLLLIPRLARLLRTAVPTLRQPQLVLLLERPG